MRHGHQKTSWSSFGNLVLSPDGQTDRPMVRSGASQRALPSHFIVAFEGDGKFDSNHFGLMLKPGKDGQVGWRVL